MNTIFNNRTLLLLSRFILGIVFIYASIDKIIDPAQFSDAIDNYHITPYSLNNLAALIIPWVELIIGLFLLLGVFLNGSSFIAILLLIFFIFIISQALIRGINMPAFFDYYISISSPIFSIWEFIFVYRTIFYLASKINNGYKINVLFFMK